MNTLVEHKIPKARKDSLFEYTFEIDTFSDPDGDALILTAPNLPPIYTFNPEMRKIEGTPLEIGL